MYNGSAWKSMILGEENIPRLGIANMTVLPD
jgi:hypothetical protein